MFKEDGQEYAQVVKMLGNGRLEANCFDGTSRLCHIRGKLRKKVYSDNQLFMLKNDTVKLFHFSRASYICVGNACFLVVPIRQ